MLNCILYISIPCLHPEAHQTNRTDGRNEESGKLLRFSRTKRYKFLVHIFASILLPLFLTLRLYYLSLSDKQVRITWRCWYPTVGVTDKEYARDTVEVGKWSVIGMREVICYRDASWYGIDMRFLCILLILGTYFYVFEICRTYIWWTDKVICKSFLLSLLR